MSGFMPKVPPRGRFGRATTIAAVFAATLVAMMLPATAGANTVRLFVAPAAVFQVKPQTIGGFTADGTAVVGRLSDGGGAMRWTSWSAAGAAGNGTYWVNDGVPSVAQGTWYGHPARVLAMGVHHARYTRLSVRWRGGTTPYESGSVLHVDRYAFKTEAGSGAWVRLVPVPSWRRFHSSYTGTDWETILSSTISAIETGFAERGLIARVTLVNGYAGGKSSQRPRAGLWATEGTVVHIRIAVYD